MMTIPWDTPHIEDDPEPIPPDRPAWLPSIGEPVDAETAARIMARYGPEIVANLERIAGIVRSRMATIDRETQLWVHLWTVDEVIQFWGAELDAVLVGFVTLDDLGYRIRFRDVRVLIDKQSGELIVRDDTELLAG